MSTAAQARDIVIKVGVAGDGRISVKQMLANASTRLRIGFRRARALYHGEARLIGKDEWDAIVARADALGIKHQWDEAHERTAALPLRARVDVDRREILVDQPSNQAAQQVREEACAGVGAERAGPADA